jgi:lipopolysaccharide export system protein LptA
MVAALRICFLIVLSVFISGFCLGQADTSFFPPLPKDTVTKRKIQIIRSDSLLFQTQELGKYRKLIGHVQLRHEKAKMFCDSAILDIDANYLTAYGRVHINDADTVDVWGDFLEYFGDQKLGRLTGNTVMRDKTMILTKTEVGSFTGGGRMVKDSTTMTATSGHYFHQTNEALFYGQVVLKDKKNTMYADSMRYNTETEIVYFISKTRIIDEDSSIIETNSGYYDTKKEKAYFAKGTEIRKESTTISADEIEYDSNLNEAKAKGNVVWRDTAEDVILLSNKSFYDEDSSFILATDNPLLMTIDKDENDTLFLCADTLQSMKLPGLPDSTGKVDSFRVTYAYHHVKMIQKDVSAVCDSLFYSTEDSIFRLYSTPLLWMDSTQISGDSIHILIKNENIDHISIFGNAFIAQLMDSMIFNQVKGKNIEAFVENEKLKRVEVDANAESIYFIQDDDKAYTGANQSESGNITMFFDKEEIQRIKLTTAPTATFTPMKLINAQTFRLPNFRWDWEKKPRDRWDVIRDKSQYEKFILNEETRRKKEQKQELESEKTEEQKPIEETEPEK